MKIYSIEEETTIVESNIDYALGMYDLYKNDEDVINALYAKGIDSFLIQKILHKIKQAVYEKRIKQAKKTLLTGSLLLLFLILVYYVLSNLPGAKTILDSPDEKEIILKISFKFYREIFYLVFLGAVLQLLNGIFSYYKYRKLFLLNKDLL